MPAPARMPSWVIRCGARSSREEYSSSLAPNRLSTASAIFSRSSGATPIMSEIVRIGILRAYSAAKSTVPFVSRSSTSSSTMSRALARIWFSIIRICLGGERHVDQAAIPGVLGRVHGEEEGHCPLDLGRHGPCSRPGSNRTVRDCG